MKRHKVTTACEACRSKKKKCDGRRPLCQPCQDSKATCLWSDYSGRSGSVSKRYVHDLEAKVRELEQDRLRQSQSPYIRRRESSVTNVSDIPQQPQHQLQQGSINLNGTGSSSFIAPRITTPSGSRVNTLDGSQTASSDYNVPLRQPLSTAIDAHLSECKNFFGTASIGSFISQMVQAVDAENQPPDGVQPFNHVEARRKMITMRAPNDGFLFDRALPPRKTADSFLSTYWTYIHPIFPFVDRIEIELAYAGLWSAEGNGSEEPVFLFILNMMFALSARLSPTIAPEQRMVAAKTFLVRAQEVLTFDLWNAGTFQSIQALLLLGQYYHTNDPHQSWMAVSMAIHTAQGLGLHIPDTSDRLTSPRAREFVRRVWHGCVMMDRILSQTYGRPPVISKKVAAAVPFPLPIDDIELASDSEQAMLQRHGSPSSMEFFVHSLELYELVADILSHFYSYRTRASQGSTVDYENYLAVSSEKSILFYENNLSKWLDTLPEYLKCGTPGYRNETLARQAVILRQRYLQIRILLLRPTLRNVVATFDARQDHFSGFDSKKLHRQLMLQCAVSCVETAQEAINTIVNNGPPDPSAVGVVSAWVHNILFLYTAATVLIAARLCPPILSCVGEMALNTSWDNAIALLRLYEPYGLPAKRAVIILHNLHEQISAKYTKHRKSVPVQVERRPTGNISELLTPNYDRDDGGNISRGQGEGRDIQEAQLDYFDLSAFDLEDFAWMDSTPFNV